jgi:hypothetical protein
MPDRQPSYAPSEVDSLRGPEVLDQAEREPSLRAESASPEDPYVIPPCHLGLRMSQGEGLVALDVYFDNGLLYLMFSLVIGVWVW